MAQLAVFLARQTDEIFLCRFTDGENYCKNEDFFSLSVSCRQAISNTLSNSLSRWGIACNPASLSASHHLINVEESGESCAAFRNTARLPHGKHHKTHTHLHLSLNSSSHMLPKCTLKSSWFAGMQWGWRFPLKSLDRKARNCLLSVNVLASINTNPRAHDLFFESGGPVSFINALSAVKQYHSDKLVPCQVIISFLCGNQWLKGQSIMSDLFCYFWPLAKGSEASGTENIRLNVESRETHMLLCPAFRNRGFLVTIATKNRCN